ncbi:exodeoxyribonuclease VII large subunit [Halobacteriovorax sp. ZH5_bin.2]|uniref:exodeoxyribonuclease VII large subunit n=1 Tax=unclassified Halobacteriovorax TaxID=2639665 RepID=UPI00371DD4DE
MNNKVPSVSQLVNHIKKNLESNYQNISVTGEVSNLSSSGAGHWYFSLGDGNALMQMALFKMDAMRNPIIKNIRAGDKVIVSGSVSVYPTRGTFQLIVKRIVPAGKGDLQEQFELLKKKLQAEGLFDMSSKQPIPTMPKRIGVITAKGAAALQDFLNVSQRRSEYHQVLLSPALVQGVNAPASIRKALEKLIAYHLKAKEEGRTKDMLDVIVLTRGGGSMEDLWAFNDEALAWDIYNCPIPTISAVGHQVDFTISDYVADLRMETPSAAAEVLTQKFMALDSDMNRIRKDLKGAMNMELRRRYDILSETSPKSFLIALKSKISDYKHELEKLNLIKRKEQILSLYEYTFELDRLSRDLVKAIQNKIVNYKNKNMEFEKILGALNPKNVLTRGYAYTQIGDKVISSAKDMVKLENVDVDIHYADGKVTLHKGARS